MGKAYQKRDTIAMNDSALQVVPVGMHISELHLVNNTGSPITFSGSAVGAESTDVQVFQVPANTTYAVHHEPYHDVLYRQGLQMTATAGLVTVASGVSS